jgi:outer membrane protein TolC
LKEAKGLFFPAVSIQARYSRAGGGRLIEIPIGDLMNPVYNSLNNLFGFHGIAPQFPTNIPNEIVPFLREREQETKLRVVQPLFQPEIHYNYKIKKSLSKIEKARVSVFKRQLIGDIRSAYFDYAKTVQIQELMKQTRILLEENLNISESLFKNGKATEDVVFRAKAELADLDQKSAEAEKNKSLAAAYFNFLINRKLDAPITLDFPLEHSSQESPDLAQAVQNALKHRHEFRQLRSALDATSSQVKLAQSRFFPSVVAVFDYGFQGEKYRFGRDDDFWMASLVFEWTLFNGNQNRSQKAQAVLEKKRLEVQMQELENQISLQVQDAFHTLKAARLAVIAAREKEKTAEKSFEIVAKKYKYGVAPQIEYIDARTTFTNAAINHILAQADYFIKKTRFEQASAYTDLEQNEQ